MPRWIRLLVGAVLALILVGFLAQGIEYVYVHYAKSTESGLVGLLEYLFTPREPHAPPPAQQERVITQVQWSSHQTDLPSSLWSLTTDR